MGHWDARVGRCGDTRRDAGDDLEGDLGLGERLGLLAAAAEDERVAALEADDDFALPSAIDQQIGDLILGHARCAGLLAHVEQLGFGSGERQGAAWDQAVVNDHVGGDDQLERPRRHQPRVPGARADQVDDPGPVGHPVPISSALARMSAPPAARMRSAIRPPSASGSESSSLQLIPQPLAAVGEAAEGADAHAAVLLERRIRSERRVAARIQSGDQRALGGQRRQRLAVGDRLGGGRGVIVRVERLDRDRPLSGRRGDLLLLDREGHLLGATEPAQSRGCQDQSVEVACLEPRQARVDVPAELDHLQVRSPSEDLGPAAQARGADPGARGTLAQRGDVADVGVPGIALSSTPAISRPSGAPWAGPWPSGPQDRPRRPAAPARSRGRTVTCRRPSGAHLRPPRP